MPLYEYQCRNCGYVFERIQKFTDPEVTKCPQCKGGVERLLSAPAVQFKGTGWYVTDYARKGGSESKASGDGTETTAPEKKEKKKEKPEQKK